MGIAWTIIMAPLNLLKAGMASFRAIMLAVNIAMYANPIGLIIAGIVLLIGAVAAVIYYWDDLKKTFSDWGVFQFLGKSIDWLIDKLNMIPGVNIETDSTPDLTMPNSKHIPQPPQQNQITSPQHMPLMPAMMGMPAISQQDVMLRPDMMGIPAVPQQDVMLRPDMMAIPKIAPQTLQLIPVMQAEPSTLLSPVQQERINAPLASYRQQNQSKVPAGGLGKQLIQANATATTANQTPAKAMHIREVHNHFTNPISPGEMEQEMWITTK